MAADVLLRDVTRDDISVFFEHQSDALAQHMVAFAAKDPADRKAFADKWAMILGDDMTAKKAILFEGHVAGNILCFTAPWSGKLEVGYWIGREFWGKGVATRALSLFLHQVDTRPLFAGLAADNLASLRVLEKCGFTVCGRSKAFSHARGEEVDEILLELKAIVT